MSATANSHRPDVATIKLMVEEARGVAVAAADDVGLPFQSDNLELLGAVKALDPAAYQRVRVLLKTSGVRVPDLDKLIAAKLGEGGNGETNGRDREPAHWSVEPWPDPVDGAALADELADVFTRHIVLPPCGAEAIALWVLHAWCIDSAGHSPLLALVSPQKRCGKSNVLILLSWLCPRAEPASSISPSVIFRVIEACCPTLLIDELDNAIDDNKDLLAILNGGHNRAMAHVLRSVGDGTDFTPRRFSAWSPKALGTIKVLPSTLADRSIVIPMSRKKAGDVVARVLSTDNAQFARLRSQCLRWSEDHADELSGSDPYLPKALDDRAVDNWRPLKAIADELGNEWAKRCWDAAEVLSHERGENEDTGVAVLKALRGILAAHAQDIRDTQGNVVGEGMHTEDILPKLHDVDPRWKEYGRSEKPITDRNLARLLDPFKVKPKPIRISGSQKRGYYLTDFADAWERYDDT